MPTDLMDRTPKESFMKNLKFLFTTLGIFATSAMLQSCDNNDTVFPDNYPTALVTVCPDDDESFVMNLDENTVLNPVNIAKSPFGKKEVRAMVSFYFTNDGNQSVESDENEIDVRNVHVCWIDSIRTKLPVPTATDNNETYGNDPFDIVKDWVTIGEDGYLTLCIRTKWGNPDKKHIINLVTGVNPDDPLEMEIHQDADGDVDGMLHDGLIAFNLNHIQDLSGDVKLKLKWNSYSGEKTAVINVKMRNQATPEAFDRTLLINKLD